MFFLVVEVWGCLALLLLGGLLGDLLFGGELAGFCLVIVKIWVLGAYHGEEHFEFCFCCEGVGFVGGHDGCFALF
jgi:hypothetical protein